jgi:hypothetical protein
MNRFSFKIANPIQTSRMQAQRFRLQICGRCSLEIDVIVPAQSRRLKMMKYRYKYIVQTKERDRKSVKEIRSEQR